jgi:hypothetical protein
MLLYSVSVLLEALAVFHGYAYWGQPGIETHVDASMPFLLRLLSRACSNAPSYRLAACCL